MKNNLLAIPVQLLLLVGSLMVTTGYSQIYQPESKDYQRLKEENFKRNPDATLISPETQQTGRQKEHAKLFTEYSEATITERVKENKRLKGGVGITEIAYHDKMGYPNQPFEIDTRAQKYAKQADAIVIVQMIKKEASLTNDGAYIFTDYTLSVEKVIKNNQDKISEKGEVVVARPGGKIVLDGVLVNLARAEYPDLKPNEKYLLFLASVPNSDGYQSLNEESSLIVRGSELKPLDDSLNRLVVEKKSLDDFLLDVQVALLQPRVSGGEQK